MSNKGYHGPGLMLTRGRGSALNYFIGSIPGAVRSVIATSINKTLVSAADEVKLGIRRLYHLRARDVLNLIRIKRASSKRPRGEIFAKSTRLPISYFKISPATPPNQKGIPVKKRKHIRTEILRGHEKEWSRAFVAKMPNASRAGLFIRNLETQGIRQPRTVSGIGMTRRQEIVERVHEVAKARFDSVISDELTKILGRNINFRKPSSMSIEIWIH
jgi:hypothetical protein